MPPLTSDQLSRLTAPTGWKLLRVPTLKTAGYVYIDVNQALTGRNAVARLEALRTWAKRNHLGLRRCKELPAGIEPVPLYQYANTGYFDKRFPTLWKVVSNKPELLDNIFGTYTCYCGRNSQSYADEGCTHCGRIYCEVCQLSFLKLWKVTNARGNTYMACAECTSACTHKKGCEGRTYNDGSCAVCQPSFTCPSCFRLKPDDKKAVIVTDDDNLAWLKLRYERQYGQYMPKGKDVKVCGECAASVTCKTCKKMNFSNAPVTKGGECALCADAKVEKERAKHEEFPRDWLPRHGSLTIPSVAFRPFRTISYEMELDGDGELVARTLYRCGLVPLSKVAGYNHSPDDKKAEYPCFMKYDGSVGAGEVIAYLLNLDDESHADALMDTCRKIHSLIQMKKASIGPTCGGHIHVDAHNFSYGDVWRLLTVFNYLEDALYRIAGAGAEWGHRSLRPEGRARNGEGYTASPVKGPFGTKGAVGQSIQAQRRNSGLNFTPYISAAGLCECGSMAYEDSKNCKCNLGKSTIEWRVFNSTANPRILHAWIALVQAMMAWSEGDDDPTPEWEKQYEPFAWTCRSFGSLSTSNKATVRSRVEWMFRNLPLTEDERDSLAYAVEQSDIDMAGVDLRGIVPINDFPHKKPPRNPARRKRAIKLEPPTPGAPEPKNAYVDGREQRIREQGVRRRPFRIRPGAPEEVRPVFLDDEMPLPRAGR
jgi:hypothetical protein